MKSFIFILSLVFFNGLVLAQPAWTENELSKAGTASGNLILSKEEKEVMLYLNLARLFPARFAELELRPFMGKSYDEKPNAFSYESTLKKTLLSMKPVPALHFSAKMYALARCFSAESSKRNITGHDRSTCPEGYDAECCSYGAETGRDVVLQLLVDDGIPSLGHRKICLSAAYDGMAPSIDQHPEYGSCCVLDFEAKKEPRKFPNIFPKSRR